MITGGIDATFSFIAGEPLHDFGFGSIRGFGCGAFSVFRADCLMARACFRGLRFGLWPP